VSPPAAPDGPAAAVGTTAPRRLDPATPWVTERLGALVLAAALAALAVGSFLAAAGLPATGEERIGANVPIDPKVAGDPMRLDQNNSPSLARSPVAPARLAVANRIDNPLFSCALHVSADGGASWQPSAIPFPAGEEDPPRCFAPDVAFAADGTLHVLFVTLYGLGNRPHAVWLASSKDGGKTLSTPTKVLGPLAFQARLAADPTRPKRLYLTWLQAADTGNLSFPSTGNPINLIRSDDAGASWTDPVRVTPAARERVVAPSLRVGPDGPFLSYLDLGDDRLDYHGGHGGRGGLAYGGTWSLVLARSTDEGRTWKEAVVADDLVPIERIVVFLPPTPALAVDPGGKRVYLAFHDAKLGDADVWLWASGDGGRTFARHRVNDTRVGDGRAQYLPQLALAGDGRLDVVYYDRRSDPHDVRNGVSEQSSFDGGRSFTPHVAVADRSFDSRIGFGSERDMADLGSRLALASGPHASLAVWTDTRAGTDASGKQDLAQGVVGIQAGSHWRLRLRLVALVLLAAALCIVVRVARRTPPEALTSQPSTPAPTSRM